MATELNLIYVSGIVCVCVFELIDWSLIAHFVSFSILFMMVHLINNHNATPSITYVTLHCETTCMYISFIVNMYMYNYIPYELYRKLILHSGIFR